MRRECKQRRHRPSREHHAECAARERQQHALSQQLTNETSAARTEGGTDRNLPFSPRGACEQKVRNVCAGDQKYEHDRSSKNLERPSHVSYEQLLQGQHARHELFTGPVGKVAR